MLLNGKYKEGIAALKADIDRAHCGYAPPGLVNAMVKAQVFKDRWMSDRINTEAPQAQKVIVAGNGHVRKDYGLPNHLPPDTVAIGIIEVKAAQLKPSDYHPNRYDFLWFTPRLDTLNPCEKYRKALEKMQRAHQGRAKEAGIPKATEK